MALAPFNDMIAQSASSLLAGFNPDAFTSFLSAQRVSLAFDSASSAEARSSLELAIDLFARLYPAVDVVPLRSDGEDTAVATRLLKVARQINPAIEGGITFTPGTAAALVVGETNAPWDTTLTPTMYIGSDGWLAKISSRQPLGSSNSANPFGAGAAVCIGAANVFRSVFGAQLGNAGLDQDTTLSLLDYEVRTPSALNPNLPEVTHLGETYLVGVGAIGHGAVWAWRRTPGLWGTIHLVDPEAYEQSNLQRYVETMSAGMPGAKVTHAAALLANGISHSLAALPHLNSWDTYLAGRSDWRFDRVLLALDSAEDRIFAQSSLPRYVINSWTQRDNLGVSRHDFLTTACVTCLYLPTTERPDLDDIVAAALNFQGEEDLQVVRRYLDTGEPLDAAMLAKIAAQVGVSEDALARFVGAQLITLYHRGACGGIILQLGGHLGSGNVPAAEVPMAFQSALAGIMLAAETVIDAAHLRPKAFPVRTEINLLKRVGGTLSTPESKHPSGRCICEDPDFIAAYSSKYDLASGST